MKQVSILHITADFPDHFRGRTTDAVLNFIRGIDADQTVISLNRRSNPFRTYIKQDHSFSDLRVFAFGYWGLPWGVGHGLSMWLAARRIRRLIENEKLRPTVIHAHKLTFEGMIAWFLERDTRIPFVASLRGEAETKILRFKPTYRPFVRKIARRARNLYAVSMWFAKPLEQLAPEVRGHITPLPNFSTPRDLRELREAPSPPRFVTICDLNVYKKKGFHWLIEALARVAPRMPAATIDVIGWTNPVTQREVGQLVGAHGLEKRVLFRGTLPRRQILDELPDYTALLLPSVNETFGVVYLEALFAGIPILYTKGTGIDGYLDDLAVGIGVSPGAVSEIASALDVLAGEAARFRETLRRYQPEICNRFSKAETMAVYMRDVRAISDAQAG